MAASLAQSSENIIENIRPSSHPETSAVTPNPLKRGMPFSPEDLPASQKQLNRQTRRKGSSIGDLTELSLKKTSKQQQNLTDKIMAALRSPEVLNAIIPIMSEKIAENIMSIIDEKVETAVKAQTAIIVKKIEGQELLSNDLKDRVFKQSNKVNSLERQVNDYSMNLEEYDNEIQRLTRKIEELETRIESQEQYSRRTSIRFHNIQVPTEENGKLKHPVDTDNLILEICKHKLGLNLRLEDISRSHVIGKVRNGKSQIIVRFISYRTRNAVYMNKKKLKDDPDGVFITENLTQYRTAIVKELARMKYQGDIDAYWTSDGKIFVKPTAHGRIRPVITFEDLQHIQRLTSGETGGIRTDVMSDEVGQTENISGNHS